MKWNLHGIKYKLGHNDKKYTDLKDDLIRYKCL